MDAYGAYRNLRDSAWRLLIQNDIRTVPVSVTRIASNADIDIVKDSDVHQLRENELGVSLWRDGKWYIVYNDSVTRGCVRFTIAHELAHIFLGHPLKDNQYTRTFETTRPIIEKEANKFAARVLMPACVIWGLNLHTVEEIQTVFDVSHEAAKIRAERMTVLYGRNKFLTSDLERRVFENFKPYIDANRRE